MTNHEHDPRGGYHQEIIALMGIVARAEELTGPATIWTDPALRLYLERLEPGDDFEIVEARRRYVLARGMIEEKLRNAARASLRMAGLPSSLDADELLPRP